MYINKNQNTIDLELQQKYEDFNSETIAMLPEDFRTVIILSDSIFLLMKIFFKNLI